MFTFQILANGLVLGCLYACIAAGFSLVWGVLNVINLMHGSFIVLGSYLAWAAYNGLGLSPWISVLIAAPLFYGLGWLMQRGVLNRVIAAPVLVTLTLTFGLDLMLNNAMLLAFKADYRKLILEPPLGTLELASVVVPVDRLVAMALALVGFRLAWTYPTEADLLLRASWLVSALGLGGVVFMVGLEMTKLLDVRMIWRNRKQRVALPGATTTSGDDI